MFEFSEFAQVVLSYGCTLFALCRLCLRLYSLSKTKWDTTSLNSLVNDYPINARIGIDIFAVYKRYGSTCLSSIIIWNALPTFWLSDAEAIKVVSSDRVVFAKDTEAVSLTVFCLNNFQVN
jgi:hypothetical protein